MNKFQTISKPERRVDRVNLGQASSLSPAVAEKAHHCYATNAHERMPKSRFARVAGIPMFGKQTTRVDCFCFDAGTQRSMTGWKPVLPL